MTEKNSDKSVARKVAEFVSDHWGEMFTVAHFASGFMNGKVSDKAPDSAKAAFEAFAGKFGGKDNPLDEITFKRLVRRLTPQQKYFLLEWLGYEFLIDHDDPWVRNKAIDALESFRVIICAMVTPAVTGQRTKKQPLLDKAGKPIKGGFQEEKETHIITPADDTDAFEYLQGLAKDIGKAFNTEAHMLGKKVSELTNDERQACETAAFAKISKDMQRQGSPRAPTADEKSFTRQVRQVFTSVGPRSSQATKVAWEKAKKTGRAAKSYATESLDRASRVTRANNYLAQRKQRARKQQQTGLRARLFERIIRSF